MEEEFVPRKLEEKKTEVKEEVKEEISNEIKKEVTEENQAPVTPNNNKKRSVGSIISQFIWILLGILVVAEVGLGVLNMQKINDDQKPVWCIEYTKTKDETVCHLGLYKIVKTKEGNKTETSLKPFFLN